MDSTVHPGSYCYFVSLLNKTQPKKSSFLKFFSFQVSYSENNFECRRFLQLLHLGEKFNPTNCNRTCDNCSKVLSLIEKDVTHIARHLVGHIAIVYLNNYTFVLHSVVYDFFFLIFTSFRLSWLYALTSNTRLLTFLKFIGVLRTKM